MLSKMVTKDERRLFTFEWNADDHKPRDEKMTTKKKKRKRRFGAGHPHISRGTLHNLCVLGFALVCAALLFFGTQGILRSYVKKHEDGKILSGVYVGNTDVSGMDRPEAIEAVKRDISACGTSLITIEIAEGQEMEISLHELGLSSPSVEDVVGQAIQYGKTGSVAQRYKAMKQSEKKKLEQRFPLEYQLEEQAASQVLTARSEAFLETPVNAALVQGTDGIQVTEAKAGEVLNTEKTIENLTRFLNEDWDGKGGTVKAVIEKQNAPVEAKDLQGLTDILGSYTTYYGGSGDGRIQNVESGANHLNGILLQPGEEQSANEAMEPYTYENGYAEADSYESNTVVQTMGGGICQVSTTLYNALLYAEIEIVERYPHSMLVSYVEPSMDAAIADDVLDLVFKNNLDSPIYIQSVLADGNLTFNIYGKETRNPGRMLTFYSETAESKETEGKRFVATEDYIGYYNIQSYSHPEINAQLWKVVTENGEETSRDVVNYSQYVAAPETYGVGVSSDDPAKTERMNSAILSQDEEVILATMQAILSGE